MLQVVLGGLLLIAFFGGFAVAVVAVWGERGRR
jgi:hypothetical protein